MVAKASEAWASAKLWSISSALCANPFALPQPSSGGTRPQYRVRTGNRPSLNRPRQRSDPSLLSLGSIGQLLEALLRCAGSSDNDLSDELRRPPDPRGAVAPNAPVPAVLS